MRQIGLCRFFQLLFLAGITCLSQRPSNCSLRFPFRLQVSGQAIRSLQLLGPTFSNSFHGSFLPPLDFAHPSRAISSKSEVRYGRTFWRVGRSAGLLGCHGPAFQPAGTRLDLVHLEVFQLSARNLGDFELMLIQSIPRKFWCSRPKSSTSVPLPKNDF